MNFYRRIASADIYTIVCQQKRHVRIAFQEESDGLRQGKMRESKERRKTGFPFLFCPPHNGLRKLNDVNTAYEKDEVKIRRMKAHRLTQSLVRRAKGEEKPWFFLSF